VASRNVVLATNMRGNVDAEIDATREQKLAAEFVKPARPEFVRDPMKIDYPGEGSLHFHTCNADQLHPVRIANG